MRNFRAHWRAHLITGVILGVVTASAGSAWAITGGADVDDGGFPFVTKLAMGDSERACSGTLVHPQLVLTAAACFAAADGQVRAGRPPLSTTATVGRANIRGGSGGTVSAVIEVIPHPDRDLALARLGTVVTSVTPIPIAATAPQAGDVLTLAGFGRTATEWVPDRMKYARFTVDSVGATTLAVVPGGTSTAGVCKGDAGGPAFRERGGVVELVGLHHDSNQAGCLGEADGAPRATETRVDDVRAWIVGNFPGFASGFEPGQARPHWQHSVDSTGAGYGGLVNVGGVCCSLTGPEMAVGTDARAHSGTKVLLYSGRDNSANASHAYTKVFKLRNLRIRPSTVLSYWIYPQSKANSYQHADGDNSKCVAVDLVYTDGTNLRDSGARDQRGYRAHPAHQCSALTLDTWNQVVVPIGTVSDGKQIATVTVGYDQPGNTGGYRGFVDDIAIDDVVATDKFATGVENGQAGPTWTNSVSTGAPRGGLLNVTGVCCGLAGPEMFVGTDDRAHTGTKVLVYSGRSTNATRAHAYTKVFGLTDVYVTPTTTLSYWIYPQSKANSYQYADGNNSKCVAVDMIFLDHFDGSQRSLRDSGATDERGNRAHPGGQCGHLTLDTWNHVTVKLGAVANGKEITQVDIGYDQAGAIGGYRGFVDDIRITP